MHQALSSLSSLTNMLSGGEYVTVSAILPMLQLIETKLLKDEAGDAQLTKDVRSHMQQDLNSRYTFPKISAMVLKILQVATFLDPRFKCHFSDDIDVADIKEILQEKGAEVIRRVVTSQPSTSEGSSSSSAVAAPPPAKKRSLGSFFKDPAEETQPVLAPEQQIKAELDAYEAILKLDPEEDPLYWWKMQSPRFPGLHSHIYLFAQQARHQNVSSAPQATLSPPKELPSSWTKLTCLCFWLEICNLYSLLLMYFTHLRRLNQQFCYSHIKYLLLCYIQISCIILQSYKLCSTLLR